MPKIVQYNLPPGGTVVELADNNSTALEIEGVDAKDYIVVDTTDGAEKLTLGNSSADVVSLGPVQVPDGSTSAPGIAFKDQTNTGLIRPSTNNIGFVCNGTTRMQISGGGDVLIASGGGSAGGRFEVIGAGGGAAIKARSAGTGDVLHTRDSANADCFVVKEDRTIEIAGYADGTLSVASGVVTSSSDARLKEFTGTLNAGLDKVLQLEPKFFNWKNDKMSQHQLGFFAQDVHAVCPEAGTKTAKMVPVGLTDPDDENSSPIMGQATDENGDPDFQWGLNHGALIALLVKSVQELTARIEQLESGS